jgi:hypothetical protein
VSLGLRARPAHFNLDSHVARELDTQLLAHCEAAPLPQVVQTSEPLFLLRWGDLVAIVDDGMRSAPAYHALARRAAALKVEHPRGYGVLIIIPENARPPSESARKAISEALAVAASGLTCLCWLVEGRGFHAATARAVLTGVRLFQRVRFETSVKSDLTEALDPLAQASPCADDAWPRRLSQRGAGEPAQGAPRIGSGVVSAGTAVTWLEPARV